MSCSCCSSGFYTRVFWHIDDCPAPKDIEPELIYENIRSALNQKGYGNNSFTIIAYGKEELGPRFSDSEFFSVAGSDEKLIRHIIVSASVYAEKGLALVVISKNLPKDTEFTRVLYALESRGCRIVIIQPPSELSSEQLFATEDSVSSYARPLDGAVHSGSSHGVDNMNPDFSTPLSLDIHALRTCIFWDVQDCSIPDDLDPSPLYESIRVSLKNKGYKYVGQMAIWAYAEKNSFSDAMLAKFREARIYFIFKVPEDKYERVQRMIHDMLLWVMDSPEDGRAPPHLIVISNDVPGDLNLTASLEHFNSRGYNVFLVQPGVDAREDLPGDPGSSLWLECLLGRGVAIGAMITTHKPMRKKKQPKV